MRTAEERRGRPKVLVRRHEIRLSDDLSEQLTEALELWRQRNIIGPVEATLGNPVAFPLLFGLFGVLIGYIYLKLMFPDPLAQARDTVEQAAGQVADLIETQRAFSVGEKLQFAGAVVGEFSKEAAEATKKVLLKLYDGLSKLPPIL